jgi:hypothetical protein
MPVTTPISGKLFRIFVATALAGPFTLIKSMNAYDKTSNRTTETVDTFDATNAYSEPGPREKGYTVNGLLVPDDPGQMVIRDAERLDTLLYIKVLPLGGSSDGTENVRGYTHAVKVGTMRHGAGTSGPQTWGFDLVSQGDEAVTVGGYVI